MPLVAPIWQAGARRAEQRHEPPPRPIDQLQVECVARPHRGLFMLWLSMRLTPALGSAQTPQKERSLLCLQGKAGPARDCTSAD